MASNGILEVTDANFDQDVLKSEQPVLVDFWAAWCGPCRALAPIVDELAKDYHGKIKVGKMDVDSNSATPMRYGVRGIPTLLVFKGGQVKEQIVGYVPKETIQKAIDKHVGYGGRWSAVVGKNFKRPGLMPPGVSVFGGDDWRILS
jgi:thioredoxin 1